MKKEIEAFVNAASEQELDAAWNNLSAEEQRVFEQLMEEEPPEDALAFFAQLYDDTPKEQASETVSISENEIYFKRQPLTEEQKKHGSYVDENGNLHVKNAAFEIFHNSQRVVILGFQFGDALVQGILVGQALSCRRFTVCAITLRLCFVSQSL